MKKILTVAVALLLVFTLALTLVGCLDEGSSERESVSDGAANDKKGKDEKSENGDTDSDKSANGMRPEFKAAMDGYEAFFDEYCAFMEKYNSSDNPAGMLGDYMSFMSRYTETMNKLDEIGEEELNNAELAYYTEVMARISQKLLAVS